MWRYIVTSGISIVGAIISGPYFISRSPSAENALLKVGLFALYWGILLLLTRKKKSV